MKKTNLLLLALLAVNVLLLVLLFTQKPAETANDHRGFGPPPHHQEGVEKMMKDEFGFTEEQISSFQSIRDEHRQTMNGFHQEIKVLKDELFSSMFDVTDSVRELQIQKIETIHGNMDRQTYAHFAKMKEVFGSDSAEFEKFFKELHSRMGPPGPPGHGPPPHPPH